MWSRARLLGFPDFAAFCEAHILSTDVSPPCIPRSKSTSPFMSTTVFSENSPRIESLDALEANFRSGEKPRPQWGVGVEHEKIGFVMPQMLPPPYQAEVSIFTVLDMMRRQGWKPLLEGGELIALQKEGASISLEPGGQFELSGAVLPHAYATCFELNTHLDLLRQISRKMNLVWLMVGRNPWVASKDMPWMPKERYAIMRQYLPQQGSMALDMMLGTATVQANFDYESEQDMAQKMRVGLGIAPIVTALFANSPMAEGRATGRLSERNWVWEHMDPARSGFIDAALKKGFGYRDYVEYALDVPMFFIHRGGRYLDCTGKSFRDHLKNGLYNHPATLEDWDLHLTTLFPHVRLKQFIEMRTADTCPSHMICAYTAFIRGIFYAPQALNHATHLVEALLGDIPSIGQMQKEASISALKAKVGGRMLQQWAIDLLAIAKQGLLDLQALQTSASASVSAPATPNEHTMLEPLEEVAHEGLTYAERLLRRVEKDWRGDSTRMLQDKTFAIF